MSSKDHIHKFKRHNYKSGNSIYFCVDDCTFKIDTALALGKVNRCWRCGQPHRLTTYGLRLAKPHCEACHNHKGSIVKKSDSSPSDSPSDSIKEIAENQTSDLRDRLNNLSIPRVSYVQTSEPDEEDLL